MFAPFSNKTRPKVKSSMGISFPSTQKFQSYVDKNNKLRLNEKQKKNEKLKKYKFKSIKCRPPNHQTDICIHRAPTELKFLQINTSQKIIIVKKKTLNLIILIPIMYYDQNYKVLCFAV